jgi:prophage tail gpP-like protein
MSDIRAKPTPGFQYRVVGGDRITRISATAYGTQENARLIVGANPQLTGRPISLEDLPTIYAGDVLNIPLIPTNVALRNEGTKLTIAGKTAEDFTLIIDGLEIPVQSAKVVRTMDTAADGWTGRIAWNPGDNKEIDRRLLPYALPDASVYLGDKLQINGILYNIEPEMTVAGIVKNLEGFSFTADAVDSSVKSPYEKNNITLQQRAEEQIQHIGIRAIFESDGGGKFDRMTADPTDTIFGHLAKYARQRSILISSTVTGDMLFNQANVNGKPVGTLEETQPLPLDWSAKYDGRQRFNSYKVIGQSPGGVSKTATAIDENVPRSRFKTIEANDTIAGDIQAVADWQRSKQLADALTIPFPVSDWYDPGGNLWTPNTIVTIISPTLDVPQGFNFLIRAIEFNYSTRGRSAILSIIPPQVYTTEELPEPWRVE